MEQVIRGIIGPMFAYQKRNNVQGKCITNAVYFMDSLNASLGFRVARVKATIALWVDEEKETSTTCVHMVVMVGDTIWDPSFEVARHDVYYIDKLSHFPRCEKSSGLSLRECFSLFLHFLEIEKRINSGGLL